MSVFDIADQSTDFAKGGAAVVGVQEETSTHCTWCEQPFQPRCGGSPQRFCGRRCRTAFWAALRRWGERALAAGVLTIPDIRNGDPAACTLLWAARPQGYLPVMVTDPRSLEMTSHKSADEPIEPDFCETDEASASC